MYRFYSTILLIPFFFFALGLSECEDDRDADGYSIEAGDCNDEWPNVNPGALELCNGFDDDCDGQIDNNCCSTAACGCWYICDGGGIPCGDGCIDPEYECHTGPGSACYEHPDEL